MHWIFPAVCPACGRDLPGRGLAPTCGPCWSSFERPPRVVPPPGVTRLHAVSLFEPPLRDLILALKYRGKAYLAAPIARWMADAAPSWAREAGLIVPVPAPLLRRVRRGYHPAALLAAEVARSFGVACGAPLRRRHGHPSQTALDRAGRLANARASFALGRGTDLRGKRVLLVDDVCTTGATLAACAALLKRAGAARVDALVTAYEEAGSDGKAAKSPLFAGVLDGSVA